MRNGNPRIVPILRSHAGVVAVHLRFVSRDHFLLGETVVIAPEIVQIEAVWIVAGLREHKHRERNDA